MTREDLRFNDTSQGLPENFDLWEELEDQTGEKISGGGIFRFINTTNNDISVILNQIGPPIIIEPAFEVGIEVETRPGDQVIVEYAQLVGGPIDSDPVIMNFDQIGTFELINNPPIITLNLV